MNRRRYLAGVAGLSAVAIAGCTEAEDEEEDEEDEVELDDRDTFRPEEEVPDE